MFRFVLNSVLIITLGLIQLSNAAFIFGIKPSLVLCFVIVSSIFSRDWLENIILVLLGALVLKFHPDFGLDDTLFVLSALTGILLVKYMESQMIISIFVAMPIATALINIQNLSAILPIQILMNLGLALLMYGTLKIAYDKK